MSDLTATNCGCGCEGGSNNCILWIILLLCCGGNNNGNGLNMLSNRYLKNICSVILKSMNYAKKRCHYDIKIPENLVISARQKQIILPREQDMAVLEQCGMANSFAMSISCYFINF